MVEASDLQEFPDDEAGFHQMQEDMKAIEREQKGKGRQRRVGPFTRGASEDKPKRSPRGRKPAAARVKADITQKIKAWLLLSNTLLELHPALAQDALDEAELEKAAEAINALAMKNDMLYGALTTVVSGSGTYEAILVLGLIGARRLARHGIIPEVIDPVAGALISMDMEELGGMLPGMSDASDTEPSTAAG